MTIYSLVNGNGTQSYEISRHEFPYEKFRDATFLSKCIAHLILNFPRIDHGINSS